MKACLSPHPAERPTFAQILSILDDMVGEVATGVYLNARGRNQARAPYVHVRACPVDTA
jgi:hypothetical protein